MALRREDMRLQTWMMLGSGMSFRSARKRNKRNSATCQEPQQEVQ